MLSRYAMAYIHRFIPLHLFSCLFVDSIRLFALSRMAKIFRMSGNRVPVRFVNNRWIFPSDRARVSNGETNRVIGVTVYSHRGFEKGKIHTGKYKIDVGFLFTSFNHNRLPLQTLPWKKRCCVLKTTIINCYYYYYFAI